MRNEVTRYEKSEASSIKDLYICKNPDTYTYQEAKQLKEESLWRDLSNISLELAIITWLNTLSQLTRKNYKSGINVLKSLELLNPVQSLKDFALINHDSVIDRIKKIPGLSEASKQARAALYISLTRFLSRQTQGIIKRANPCKEGTINTTKTFGATRDSVKSEALTKDELTRLILAMNAINPRDALIVKLCLQGAKRIGETLNLRIEKVDFEKKQATFKQSKTKGIEKEIIVNLPEHLAEEIKGYVGDRKYGFVFVTWNGKGVLYNQIYDAMKRAAKIAKIDKNIHPHCLRTSAITLHIARGASDSEILKLSGHSSTQMLSMYDKTSREDNASRFALV